MGEGYEVVYYCALLLIAPSLFYLSQQIAKNTAVIKGYVKHQAMVNIIKVVFNIALVTVLSYFFGVLGAAISISISYFVRNIGMNVIYQKKLGLNMWKFHFECYVKTLPGILLCAVLAIGFNHVFPNYSWWTFVAKVASICACYAVCIWLLSFNKYEKALVVDTIKKIFHKGKRRES